MHIVYLTYFSITIVSSFSRVRYIMPENLSIMLLSVTLKTITLCLKLCSKSSRLCSTILGYNALFHALLKKLGSENFSLRLCKYWFCHYYSSLYDKKMPIMPALCSMLRLYHYAQNYAGIMYLTLNFSWVLQSSRKNRRQRIRKL